MAAPTADDIKTWFPEFNAVDDAVIEVWLGLAVTLVCENAIGATRYPMAVGFLTAHYLQRALTSLNSGSGSGGSGSGQNVSSMSVGDVSIDFDTSAAEQLAQVVGTDAISAELALTRYGQQYLSLARRSGHFVGLTGGLPNVGAC